MDQQGRTVDGLGRVVPGRVNVVGMLGVPAVWEVFGAFREVPDGFVIRRDGAPVAVVCPCGLGHLLPGLLREAECGRFFLTTSRRVESWRPRDVTQAADGLGGQDRTLDPSRPVAA